jgi:hypothetical protein
MPAIAALVLKDNTATDVTFTPAGQTNGVTTFMTNDSVFDAKRKVTTSVALPKPGSSVARIKFKCTVPVMDPVDTTKKVAEIVLNVDAVIPKQASVTQRVDARNFVRDLMAHANVTTMFASLENYY